MLTKWKNYKPLFAFAHILFFKDRPGAETTNNTTNFRPSGVFQMM